MSSARKPWWQKATAVVSLSASGAVTGFSFAHNPTADLSSPSKMMIHLMALDEAGQPVKSGQVETAGDAQLRSAIVSVARYYLRMAAGKTPAEMEAVIWEHDSIDGANHGQSCAAFASLTLELGARVVGQRSWVTGGTTYPWPLHKWADVRVDPNPDSLGITSVLQDAEAHHRWHPLGDGYQPRPGDWVLFHGHVEVVTEYSGGVLHTIGGDSLPNYSVNAHEYSGSLAAGGVAGFVNNGDLAQAGPAAGSGGAGSRPAPSASSGPAPSASSRAPHTSGSDDSHQHGNDQHGAGRDGGHRAGAGQQNTGLADIPGTDDHGSSADHDAPVSSAAPSKPTAPSSTATPASKAALTDEAGKAGGAAIPGLAAAGQSGTAAGGVPGVAPGHQRATARSAARRAITGHVARSHPTRTRAAAPHAAGPRTAAPKTAGPPAAGPRAAGPQTDGPQTAGPRADGPHASEPRATGTGSLGSTEIPGLSGTTADKAPRAASPAHRYTRHHAPPPPAQVSDTSAQQAFINEIAPGAIAAQRDWGIPASVTIAQAIDESGWGSSDLASQDHNLFGIKGDGPAGSDAEPTHEFVHGHMVQRTASFRVYRDVAQSIADHGRLLATSGYYTRAMADRDNPDAFAAALTGVYATDPDYGAKLVGLMRRYDLYRYDTAAPGGSSTPAASTPAASTGTTSTGPPSTGTPGTRTPGPAAPSPGNTSPGNTSPGNTSPGNTSPGNTSPGNTSPGNTSPGNTSPGNASAGQTSPAPTGAAPAAGATQPTGTRHRPATAGTPGGGLAGGTTDAGAVGGPADGGPAGGGPAGGLGGAAIPGVGPATVPGTTWPHATSRHATSPHTAAARSTDRRAAPPTAPQSLAPPPAAAAGGPESQPTEQHTAQPAPPQPSQSPGSRASRRARQQTAEPTPPRASQPRTSQPRNSQPPTSQARVSPAASSAARQTGPQTAPSAPRPAPPPTAGGALGADSWMDTRLSAPAPAGPSPRARRAAAEATAPQRPAPRRAAPRRAAPRSGKYKAQIPVAVQNAFAMTARLPLLRAEPLYRDIAEQAGIRWQLLAASDWMQCKAQPRYSPVHGERLGTVNSDGTSYRTKSEALDQCADDLIDLSWAVYQIDLTQSRPLSVRELASVFAAFRWGGLLKLHHTSALEFPYSVAGLTDQHTGLRWPNIADSNTPDKPGSRFRQPFGAVPVVLILKYPAAA